MYYACSHERKLLNPPFVLLAGDDCHRSPRDLFLRGACTDRAPALTAFLLPRSENKARYASRAKLQGEHEIPLVTAMRSIAVSPAVTPSACIRHRSNLGGVLRRSASADRHSGCATAGGRLLSRFIYPALRHFLHTPVDHSDPPQYAQLGVPLRRETDWRYFWMLETDGRVPLRHSALGGSCDVRIRAPVGPWQPATGTVREVARGELAPHRSLFIPASTGVMRNPCARTCSVTTDGRGRALYRMTCTPGRRSAARRIGGGRSRTRASRNQRTSACLHEG